MDNKIIKEMAKDLKEEKLYALINKTSYMRSAENLYDLGYRKIDKDSVVLNSEQYSNYLITQTNNEFLKEQAEKLKADIERLYKNIGKFIVSKEKDTAEKILKWLKEHCDFVGFVLVETYFKEEFGVEVDE